MQFPKSVFLQKWFLEKMSFSEIPTATYIYNKDVDMPIASGPWSKVHLWNRAVHKFGICHCCTAPADALNSANNWWKYSVENGKGLSTLCCSNGWYCWPSWYWTSNSTWLINHKMSFRVRWTSLSFICLMCSKVTHILCSIPHNNVSL